MTFPEPFQHVTQLALLAFTAVALGLVLGLGRSIPARARRATLGAMVVVAALSTFNYFRAGQLHGYGVWGNHSYHYHDIYHYAVGAKYYPELGYERLYNCTWLALDELHREEKVAIPTVVRLRDLSKPNTWFDPRQKRKELGKTCHAHFSDARWEAFRNDLHHGWLDRGWEHKWWQVMLSDLGFNPPPTWNAIAHPLAHTLDLSKPNTLELWPWLDVTLVLVVGGGMVTWAFGPWGLVAYLTVIGCNWIASYRWTGGSFCRQLWFAFLVWGVCLLQLKRHTAAGVALALSVCMRIFPAVFVIGALIPLVREARKGPEGRTALLRFGAAGVTTTVALVGLSLLLFDASLWPEFFHKMSHHGNTFFMWHVGFKKLAVYLGGDVYNLAAYKGLAPTQNEAFQVWLNQIYEGKRWLFDPIRGLLCLAAAGLAWRRTPAEAAWMVGAVWMYCLSIPANYYWIHLALFPVVFWNDRGGPIAGVRMFLFFASMVSVSMSTWVSGRMHDQSAWYNGTILLFLVILLVTVALEARSPDAEPQPSV